MDVRNWFETDDFDVRASPDELDGSRERSVPEEKPADAWECQVWGVYAVPKSGDIVSLSLMLVAHQDL